MATTLLLADDSPTIAKILVMALQSEPYEIRSVLTAEEAIRELKNAPPYFFLVDLSLPGKNGYEFTRLIRRDSKLRDIRVVLLASAFEPVDEAEYASCGADGLVKKPFDPAELRNALRAIHEAPPKFPDSARVTGSLSGFMVADPKDSTRTNLTIGGLSTSGNVDTNPSVLGDQDSVASLLGGSTAPRSSTSGGDADSILAGLLGESASSDKPEPTAGNPPPFFTAAPESTGSQPGEFRPDKTILLDLNEAESPPAAPTGIGEIDLSASFDTPPGGTQQIELGTHTVNYQAPATPPAAPPKVSPVDEPLSANAQALAAFFEAEIHSAGEQAAEVPPPAPRAAPPSAAPRAAAPAPATPTADDFDASLDSIDWGTGPADASLNQWSSPAAAAPAPAPAMKPTLTPSPEAAMSREAPPPFSSPAAPAAPPRSARTTTGFTEVPRAAAAPAPAKKVEPARPAGAGADPSLLFDTGGSSFRFSEDYIRRITMSFTGAEHETLPERQAPMFHQQSDDRGGSEPPAEAAPAAAPASIPREGGGPAEVRERYREGGGAWSEGEVQKIEQIVREEVQMVVREVAEKIAWEVIPELAENLIRKELEKVLKDLGQ